MATAERIYGAVARDGASAALRGEMLARRMEEEIAAGGLGAGENLGSVRELAARYGAGRSTVCEAVRILEQRGLGRMRTGRGGGLILTKPDLTMVAEELSDFFRLAGVSLRQLMDAREAVDGAAARLAAETPRSGAELAGLRRLAEPREDSVIRDLAFRAGVAGLAGDPALRLFVECLNSLTLDFASLKADDAEGRPACPGAAAREGLIAALGRGDCAGAADASSASLHLLERGLHPTMTPGREGPHADAVGECHTNRSSEIARTLAAELKQHRVAGSRLGSEWELCERLGVGRLILRQAIRMLEDRGLVASQRGRGHGLVACEPQAFGAIRQAVAWLMTEQFDPMNVGKLLCLLNLVTPLLAVTRARGPGRRRLETVLAAVEACDPIDRSDVLEMVRCVAELSDVPLVDVFCRCLVAYEARFREHFPESFSLARQRPYIDHLRRLLKVRAWTPDTSRLAKAETVALMLAYSQRASPC